MRTTEHNSPCTVHLNTKNRVVNVGFFSDCLRSIEYKQRKKPLTAQNKNT